ncbi:MAG: hypothetical protein M3457_11375 [Chloroflexota bacterium]|nr:hypothetical protein [Chloroflexota bacterium]
MAAFPPARQFRPAGRRAMNWPIETMRIPPGQQAMFACWASPLAPHHPGQMPLII